MKLVSHLTVFVVPVGKKRKYVVLVPMILFVYFEQ